MKDSNNIALSKEQQEKAIEWLKKKWLAENHACDICSHKQWSVLKNIVAPLIFTDTGMAAGGEITPQFMLMCQNCGNTRYFNAVISGLLAKEEERQDGK